MKPKRPTADRANGPTSGQRALFAGLDGLAGQLDLFETDGQREEITTEKERNPESCKHTPKTS